MSLVFKALFGIFLNGLALYLLTLIIDVIQYGGGLKLFIIAGVILGLINMFVKPVVKLLALPLVLLTGGLFLIVINALVLFALTYLLDVFSFKDVYLHFPNVLSYVIGGIVFGIINWAEHLAVK